MHLSTFAGEKNKSFLFIKFWAYPVLDLHLEQNKEMRFSSRSNFNYNYSTTESRGTSGVHASGVAHNNNFQMCYCIR